MASVNTNNVSLRISAGNCKQFPTDRMCQVAISGRSNVGKSSLINMLLSRKSFARVSSSPGKTVTVNYYDIDKKLFLVDLPGYGFAKRSDEDKKRWSALTDGYFTNNPNIDLLKLVIQLTDSRIGPTDDDIDMMKYLSYNRIPYIVVATKSDKLSAARLVESIANISAMLPQSNEKTIIVPCSSVTGVGKNEIWKHIFNAVNA